VGQPPGRRSAPARGVRDLAAVQRQLGARGRPEPGRSGPHGPRGGFERIRPGFIKRDEIAWVATHRHGRETMQPYLLGYVFGYALDVPPGRRPSDCPKTPPFACSQPPRPMRRTTACARRAPVRIGRTRDSPQDRGQSLRAVQGGSRRVEHTRRLAPDEPRTLFREVAKECHGGLEILVRVGLQSVLEGRVADERVGLLDLCLEPRERGVALGRGLNRLGERVGRRRERRE